MAIDSFCGGMPGFPRPAAGGGGLVGVWLDYIPHAFLWALVGVVAKYQIFVNFFFVLAIMLAFSNAVASSALVTFSAAD